MINTAKIRKDFPILDKKILNQKDLIYFDTAASAQKPEQVISEMDNFYRQNYSNVSRGIHTLSVESTFAFEEARVKVQKFINASSEKEIIFTKSATESINLIAQTFAQKNINEGDEIVLTTMEHHSNLIPWFLVRDKYKCTIKFANIDKNGHIDKEHFESLLNDKTKIVAITHLSNVFGTETNSEILKLCNDRNIPVLLDGCQSAAHLDIDVQKLGCDFYVFSGHKLYGPSGIGILYGKEEILEKLPPYQGGGGMIADVTLDGATFTGLPAKYEAGTPPIVEAFGLGVAIDYITEIGMKNINNHESELTKTALNEMMDLDFVEIYGTSSDKNSIISFNLENIHSHEVASFLDVEGVAIRAGHHCCQPLMKKLNVNSTSRMSFGIYNTADEIKVFINAIKKCRDFFKK